MPLRLSPSLDEAKERACTVLMAKAGSIVAAGGLKALDIGVEAIRAAQSVAEVHTTLATLNGHLSTTKR